MRAERERERVAAYLAVNGEELASHVLVFISEDDLHLVPATGHHWSEVVRGDVDSPERK